MIYTGEKCVACGKAFTVEDDVVVCPECGSPHHRDCYNINKRCENISLHEAKEKWKRSSDDDTESDEIKSDTVPAYAAEASERSEGHSDEPYSGGLSEDMNVENRGEFSEGDINAALSFIGFNPNDDMGGATVKEVSQFVGTNTLYYLPIFKRMKDFGTKISFNISCLIFPPLYFANRRMWGWAIISALLTVFLGLPELVIMIGQYLEETGGYESVLSVIYDHKNTLQMLSQYMGMGSWIMSIVLCMFGNWFYYRYVIRSIRKIKTACPDDSVKTRYIMSGGGVRPINILLITVIMSAVSLFLLYGFFTALI